ncbi:phosphodiesterase [Jiella endophytica]|uniref:Phosphodiesterase n=1 Tax=Jiella endophytica TaxID=2558362 RepID=A0A4Y8RKI6_9HYPH|nr:metallophosphoesterase [Jiella endophytica]TFF23232.1 phosphodiesterase [Jiella endophytica]
MGRETTFVHLTDLHLGDPDDAHLFSDTDATLGEILALVATIDPAPAFIVASGDLSNRGEAASYRRLKAVMEETGLPVVYAIGNHDTRAGFYEGMLGRSDDLSAPYDHDTVIAGIHIVTIDSTIPGAIGGSIEPEQFAWLGEALARHTDLPKLLVIHHPPALGEDDGGTPWRMVNPEQSAKLAAMLKDKGVVGILSGHIHHDRVSSWHGMLLVVGIGQHAATDILATEELRMVRGAGFGIGTIRPSGLTMALVPLPSDRAELNRYPLAMLRERAARAAE